MSAAAHININKLGGLSQGWVGGSILFMFFFLGVIPYGGESAHKQNPQNIWGQSGEWFVFQLFSFCSVVVILLPIFYSVFFSSFSKKPHRLSPQNHHFSGQSRYLRARTGTVEEKENQKDQNQHSSAENRSYNRV